MNGFEWLFPRHETKQGTFDIILDACLEDMRLRHVSIAACLKKYPAQADELCPLLEMAAALDSINSLGPTSGFRQVTRRKLMNLPDPGESSSIAPIKMGLWNLPLRLMAVMAALLLLLTVATSVADAAYPVLPGSPLYSLKRQTENLQLVFQMNPTSQALTHAALADRRLEEAQALATSGQTQLAEQATVEYGEQVTLALANLRLAQQEPSQPSAAQLGALLQREQLELSRNKEHAPEESKPVLEHALTLSAQAQEQLAMISPLPAR